MLISSLRTLTGMLRFCVPEIGETDTAIAARRKRGARGLEPTPLLILSETRRIEA